MLNTMHTSHLHYNHPSKGLLGMRDACAIHPKGIPRLDRNYEISIDRHLYLDEKTFLSSLENNFLIDKILRCLNGLGGGLLGVERNSRGS